MSDAPNSRSGLSVATVNTQLAEKRIAMAPATRKSKAFQTLTNLSAVPLVACHVDAVYPLHEIQFGLVHKAHSKPSSASAV